MYAFAQRSDTQVYDEPLYAHYLSKTPAHTYHPGAAEVLASQEQDGERVVAELLMGQKAKPIAFFKHMTHHLFALRRDFLAHTVNVLLTRDPYEMLPSYAVQVREPTINDVGYAAHIELLHYLHSIGQNPPVLDGKQVLLNPRKVLGELCERIGIPFEESMLSWPAGGRPEDGVWATYWYHAVHQSTGFTPYQPPSRDFPAVLRPLLAECQPYYAQLEKMAIKA
jgi:hypothetical protein